MAEDLTKTLVVRSRLAVVKDVRVGAAREVRPDSASSAEADFLNCSWPPPKGDYDDTGRVLQAGELASLGLVPTFEEVRAATQGMVGFTAKAPWK